MLEEIIATSSWEFTIAWSTKNAKLAKKKDNLRIEKLKNSLNSRI